MIPVVITAEYLIVHLDERGVGQRVVIRHIEAAIVVEESDALVGDLGHKRMEGEEGEQRRVEDEEGGVSRVDPAALRQSKRGWGEALSIAS